MHQIWLGLQYSDRARLGDIITDLKDQFEFRWRLWKILKYVRYKDNLHEETLEAVKTCQQRRCKAKWFNIMWSITGGLSPERPLVLINAHSLRIYWFNVFHIHGVEFSSNIDRGKTQTNYNCILCDWTPLHIGCPLYWIFAMIYCHSSSMAGIKDASRTLSSLLLWFFTTGVSMNRYCPNMAFTLHFLRSKPASSIQFPSTTSIFWLDPPGIEAFSL